MLAAELTGNKRLYRYTYLSHKLLTLFIFLLGYQRLALQMIGAFNSPISKKKLPMTWDEITSLINEIREELGLR